MIALVLYRLRDHPGKLLQRLLKVLVLVTYNDLLVSRRLWQLRFPPHQAVCFLFLSRVCQRILSGQRFRDSLVLPMVRYIQKELTVVTSTAHQITNFSILAIILSQLSWFSIEFFISIAFAFILDDRATSITAL